MARYPLGQPVRASTTVKQLNTDGTQTLVNAGTLTLAVTKPDVTVQSYSAPLNDGVGAYHQDIPAADITQLGHYQYTWIATGAGAGVSFGDFDVFDPLEPAILPLQDAKDTLNIPQAITVYDTEINSWIATIETSLEAMTGGPIITRTVSSERCVLTSGYTVLQVRQRPLVSVTSIVASSSGVALDISAGLDLDVNAGTIRRKLGWPFYGNFFTYLPVMLVTYTAGWGLAVPPAMNSAARIILSHLWETQHGGGVMPSMAGGAEMVTPPGFEYAIPNRAAELLAGSLNGMPFAIEAYV